MTPTDLSKVAERPILFSGPMIRAILDGRKSMTRRVVKPQPADAPDKIPCSAYTQETVRKGQLVAGPEVYGFWSEDAGWACPYGRPGDRLYLKETHWRWGRWRKNGLTKAGKQAWRFVPVDRQEDHGVRYCVDDPLGAPLVKPARTQLGWHKRPAIFLPKSASRITLELIAVRVERVLQISESDATAEGILPMRECECQEGYGPYASSFLSTWDHLNAKRGHPWAKNDFVWTITFKRV